MTPGNPQFWFSLPFEFVDWEAWARYPDRDLYVCLVRDAWVARRRSIRYSHKKYAEKVAFTDGNNPRHPGVEQMRGALRRLRDAGRITYDEPGERQRQGRRQGFFVVSLVNWPPPGFESWFTGDPPPEMAPEETARKAKDAPETPREKERDKHKEKEKIAGPPGGAAAGAEPGSDGTVDDVDAPDGDDIVEGVVP